MSLGDHEGQDQERLAMGRYDSLHERSGALNKDIYKAFECAKKYFDEILTREGTQSQLFHKFHNCFQQTRS